MDFVGGGGSGGGLGSDNGPILFTEPNRTSAIDDLRSLVIYIFIITIFISFFLILPGIRNDKLPTFLCIIPSLIVTSIILIALFGTTWHVGYAPISAPYKAFSKDRIQGELSVKIGLRSVNITLRAHKYYELHASHKPVILDDFPSGDAIIAAPTTTTTTTITTANIATSSTTTTKRPAVDQRQRVTNSNPLDSASNLAEELLGVRGPDAAVAAELEEDEADFADPAAVDSDPTSTQAAGAPLQAAASNGSSGKFQKRSTSRASNVSNNRNQKADNSTSSSSNATASGDTKQQKTPVAERQVKSSVQQQQQQSQLHTHKYTIERSNVDINYNERFYWIEPNQMRQEHHNALERGLPYPILTVVEYLSQDEAGFSWSRQYRLAGYYSHVILWLSLCVCVLMFFLHCAAPKYGIYTMQCLGCLLLFTNFTYATLVPRGDRKLVIPFEGRSLSLQFGWNYWLVLIGGCLSLSVGTLIVIIDSLFPNFIFTTILDVDFDSHNQYYKKRHRRQKADGSRNSDTDGRETPTSAGAGALERPTKPPFYDDSTVTSKVAALAAAEADSAQTTTERGEKNDTHRRLSFKVSRGSRDAAAEMDAAGEKATSPALFLGPLIKRTPLAGATFPNDSENDDGGDNGANLSDNDRKTSDSEIASVKRRATKQDHSSVVNMLDNETFVSDRIGSSSGHGAKSNRNQLYSHYGKSQQQQVGDRKNNNPKTTDHESHTRRKQHQQVVETSSSINKPNDQVRL